MADLDVTRKLLIYRALYRINRAFAHINRNLDELHTDQFFKRDQPDEDHPQSWEDRLGETQAEINRRITENLHNLEHGDMKRLHRIAEMAPEVRKLYFGDELEHIPPKSSGKKRRK